MSICIRLQNKEHVIEALHRAKFKFPDHQKIHIPKKWGFTNFNANEFDDLVTENGSSQMAVGSNILLMAVPWKNGGLGTHESLLPP